MSLQKGLIIGKKYQLIEQITSGGMCSSIWRAKFTQSISDYQNHFNPFCVIKFIPFDKKNYEEQIKNVNKEIKILILVSTRSKVFCKVLDYLQIIINEQQYVILVLEYIKGQPLNNYLQHRGVLPLVEAVNYFEQILDGLNELHNLDHEQNVKILHRDLKLSNIIITDDFTQIKIIDFGISSILSCSLDIQKQNNSIDNDNIYGSIPYVPPDIKYLYNPELQKEKQEIITEYFDIFAAGVIFFNLLTGEFPYYFSNQIDMENFLRPEKYDFPALSNYIPEIPTQIENILFKCLVSQEKDKHHRYKTVKEIINDLKEWKENPNQEQILIKQVNERIIEKKPPFFSEKIKKEIIAIWNYKSWIMSIFLLTTLILLILFIVL